MVQVDYRIPQVKIMIHGILKHPGKRIKLLQQIRTKNPYQLHPQK